MEKFENDDDKSNSSSSTYEKKIVKTGGNVERKSEMQGKCYW